MMTILTAADIIVFSGILVISVGAGIYFAIKDRKKLSTDNYYFGGRNVSPILVAASLVVSHLSAFTIVAFSAEVYLYGFVYAWDILASILSKLIAAVWYIPIYQRLKPSSVFEYLELRFNRTLRIFTSFMSGINLLIFLGTIVYMPALSISAITSLDLYVSIMITSIFCTFYTTIGGMKAVIWTDMIQSLMMLAGTLALFVSTVVSVGGLHEMAQAVERGGRNNFLTKFNPDPRIRSSFWTIITGFTIGRCHNTCCAQINIQRYLSCKTVRSARIAMLLAIIPDAIIVLLCIANGLAMYSYFEDCDPHSNGELEKVDQSIPYLALKVFKGLPGMTGLFVTAIFSGTLSTVSSGINAMSSLFFYDFLLPCLPSMKERMRIIVSMGLSIIFGSLVTILSYAISNFDSNIMGIVYAFVGVVNGPLLGLFTMAALFPWVNGKGAACGFVCGSFTIICIGTVAFFNSDLAYSPEENGGALTLSTDGCIKTNSTNDILASHTENVTFRSIIQDSEWNDQSKIENMVEVNTTTPPTTSNPIASTLLSISPFLYGFLGWIICVVVGNVASLLIGGYDPTKTNWGLFAPGIRSLFDRRELHEKLEAQRMVPLLTNSERVT